MFALLIGNQAQGKTTTCRHLAEQSQAAGLLVGGIVQPAVYQENVCIGYDVLDLASGRSVRLASVSDRGVQQVGRFQFLADGLAFGQAALRRAAVERPRLIIIDEVGPLELAGGGWAEQLDDLSRSFTRRQADLSHTGSQFMLWTARRKLAAGIETRWMMAPASTAEDRVVRRYDLSTNADAIIGDIIMSLHPEST